jgi:hypothetical protein
MEYCRSSEMSLFIIDTLKCYRLSLSIYNFGLDSVGFRCRERSADNACARLKQRIDGRNRLKTDVVQMHHHSLSGEYHDWEKK